MAAIARCERNKPTLCCTSPRQPWCQQGSLCCLWPPANGLTVSGTLKSCVASPPEADDSGAAAIAVYSGGGSDLNPTTGGKLRPGRIGRLLLHGSAGRRSATTAIATSPPRSQHFSRIWPSASAALQRSACVSCSRAIAWMRRSPAASRLRKSCTPAPPARQPTADGTRRSIDRWPASAFCPGERSSHAPGTAAHGPPRMRCARSVRPRARLGIKRGHHGGGRNEEVASRGLGTAPHAIPRPVQRSLCTSLEHSRSGRRSDIRVLGIGA